MRVVVVTAGGEASVAEVRKKWSRRAGEDCGFDFLCGEWGCDFVPKLSSILIFRPPF